MALLPLALAAVWARCQYDLCVGVKAGTYGRRSYGALVQVSVVKALGSPGKVPVLRVGWGCVGDYTEH